jgi:hypothetical protein
MSACCASITRCRHSITRFYPSCRLSAVNQRDFMTAIAGDDSSLWHDKVGFFAPGSNMASEEGEALNGPRDLAAAAMAIKDAGYKGETVLLMAPGDFPVIGQMSAIAADLFRRLGFNLDYVVMDWGSMLKRMNSRETPDKGGYNAFCTYSAGVTQLNPSPITSSAGVATRRPSAGRGVPSWRSCAMPGWSLRTPRRRKRSASRCSARRSSTCPMCRLASSTNRPPTRRI